MNFLNTAIQTTCATLLLSCGIATAATVPKVVIEKNAQSKTLFGTAVTDVQSARSATWHYGDINDNVVFSSNISIANRSGSTVYTTTEFYGTNILDNDYLMPNDIIDNITTNFTFSAVHLTLRDNHHEVFFDGNVYPNTHFIIRPVNTYITFSARAAEANPKLELVQQ